MLQSDERPTNSDVQGKPTSESLLEFDELVSSHGDLSEIFFKLTRQLCKDFDIHKGVLVLRHKQPNKLAVVCTWKHGLERDGLALNLPCESSLFEKVAQHGYVYTENFCEAFGGNFFERKLLLDDGSRSFALQPLKSNGHVVGLVGYSSLNPTAFIMFEEGMLENEAGNLATIIETRLYSC